MNLNYLLVGTPDKVCLKSFLKFIKRQLGPGFVIAEMHSLMSDESKKLYVDDFSKKYPQGIFSYYAKGILKSPEDPLKFLPERAKELSEVIVWFDLYSTLPRVLKDSEGFLKPVCENWEKFIKSLSA